jgi:hypothetical protein
MEGGEMKHALGGFVAAGLLAGLVMAPATHAQVTKDESKCQTGGSGVIAKFVAAKQKCITKCEAGARKGQNPATDCDPPYAGTTAACITDPVKGAEAKAVAGFQKACSKDCPECYSGGNCTTEANTRVTNTETQVDVLVAVVYCDDSASGDGLTTLEAKCQDATAKTLAKFVGAKSKCYAKCETAEASGKLPPNSCNPPTAADPKTAACVDKAEAKSIAGIDKACAPPKGESPECYAGSNGTSLTGLVETAVDSTLPGTYCASPSGAFVQ